MNTLHTFCLLHYTYYNINKKIKVYIFLSILYFYIIVIKIITYLKTNVNAIL